MRLEGFEPPTQGLGIHPSPPSGFRPVQRSPDYYRHFDSSGHRLNRLMLAQEIVVVVESW